MKIDAETQLKSAEDAHKLTQANEDGEDKDPSALAEKEKELEEAKKKFEEATKKLEAIEAMKEKVNNMPVDRRNDK